MVETTEQYVARMLSYVGSDDPRAILEATPSTLQSLVAGQTRDALAYKPDPDRWSVVEILAHLADAEVVGAWRIRSVLAEDGLPLQPYDQNRWAAAFRNADADPAESLDLFRALRSGTLRLVRRVDPALLEHYGVHGERGRETVTHILRLYAGHDRNHTRQIERLLATKR